MSSVADIPFNRQFGMDLSTDLPTLRSATVKFTKLTTGKSGCELVSLQHTHEVFQSILKTKGKILTTVTVAVVSEKGMKALEGIFTWLILRSKEH